MSLLSKIQAHYKVVAGKNVKPIPKDWPVQPLKPGQNAEDKATCGHCGLSWDDGISTSMTPTPSARCPFEQFHVDPRIEQQPKPKNTSDKEYIIWCENNGYVPSEKRHAQFLDMAKK